MESLVSVAPSCHVEEGESGGEHVQTDQKQLQQQQQSSNNCSCPSLCKFALISDSTAPRMSMCVCVKGKAYVSSAVEEGEGQVGSPVRSHTVAAFAVLCHFCPR